MSKSVLEYVEPLVLVVGCTVEFRVIFYFIIFLAVLRCGVNLLLEDWLLAAEDC